MPSKLATLVFLLAALTLGAAAPAGASIVLGTEHQLVALQGEQNHVTIAYDAGAAVYVIEDAAGIRAPGPTTFARHGCTPRTPTVVACAWPELEVELGDGDDRLTVATAASPRTVSVVRNGRRLETPLGVVASGGPGNDVLTGNAASDGLYGGGSWSLDGVQPVPDDVGNDTVTGGDGHDVLTGDGGVDRLDGGPGDDLLDGGAGNDRLAGELGSDMLDGGTNDDALDAGAGDDVIRAFNGRDVADAGAGDDEIYSLDGLFTITAPSTIKCGAGTDWFEPEQGDVVSGCEQIFEEWPRSIPLCSKCTFRLEARVGSRITTVARTKVAVSAEKPWAVLTFGRQVQTLLRSRGSLRARLVYKGGDGRSYGREWFVLRR